MKKILTTIVFILICYLGYGQYPITTNLGGPTTLVKNPNYGGFQGGLIPYTFADTTAANAALTYGKTYNGFTIYTQSPQATWWRLADSSKWVMILPQGGGTPVSGQAWINPGNFNLFTDSKLNGGFGTLQANGIYFKTNGVTRAYLDRYGIAPETGTTVGIGIDPSDSNRITFFTGGSSSTPTLQQVLATQGNLAEITSSTDIYATSPTQELLFGDNGVWSTIQMLSKNSVTMRAETSTNDGSRIVVLKDSILIQPYLGLLKIDTLTNVAARYVLHYSPTTGLVSYADTTASSSGSSSLTNLLNINQVPHSGIVVSQDSVIIFGDSYVVGTGATSAAKGWAPVLSSYMNAILDNRGVDGTTLEKRTPVDWVGGAATNMIDLLPTVPVKTAKKKLLIIALALNDWGYNGGQYNPVNYKTDYDSVMNYITNTKGWPAKNVLIIPPYWIGAAGRTQYAGLSGNSAPTYAQALVFIDSTKAVANQWGTLYFDIYHDQYNNDTTLFNGGNPIHPDDSGFLYIARDIYTYLAPNIQLWKQNTTNEVMPYFATNTPASTTTPASINLGASYASSAGLPGSTKLKLYYDGTANNTVGFGVSTAGLESNVFPGGTFDYYVGAYKIASFGVGNANIRTAVQFSGYGAGAATFDASGNITSVSDMRLKNLQGYYHGGLTELMNITPIIYKWKPGSGMETTHDYIGFSAQNIKSVLGEGSYGVNSKGYLSIQDRAIMATMVNAIQELQKEVNDLKQQIKNK